MIFNNSSGAALPDLANPASANDVISGKEYIDGDGEKQTGISGYYKLLQAKNIISTTAQTIDLLPEDFNGIPVLGGNCFTWYNKTASSPLRSIIFPNDIHFSGQSTTVTGRHQFYGQTKMLFVIFQNGYSGDIRLSMFDSCSGLLLMIFSKNTTEINNSACTGQDSIKAYILPKKGVIELKTTGGVTKNKNIYVPDSDEDGNDLVSAYKSATNWSATSIADHIHGFSEAPVYDNTTEYSVGDVCKYDNSFYAYYNLENTTGNSPSGTTENTPYWWYCGECGGVIND